MLLFYVAFSAYAQNTFQQGYFISTEGNTTECLIKNLAWKNNPTFFDYKLSENGDINTKTIDEVKEFSVNNAYKFEKYNIQVDKATNDLGAMSSNKEPVWKNETVLLKVLVEGDVTLYQYEQTNLVRYFVKDKNTDVPVQLIYKPYKVDNSVGYNTKFRGQLYDIMKDKITDRNLYKSTDYDLDDLVKLFAQYNGTTDSQVGNLASKQNKSSINLKITPGISFAAVFLKDASHDDEQIDFGSKSVFRLGAELEMILPFNNNKWSLFTDPNFQVYKNEFKTSEANGTIFSEWEVSYQFIEIPLGARHYFYINNTAKIFIDALYVTDITVGDAYAKNNYTRGVGRPEITYNYDIAKTSHFAAGLGFGYNKFSAEARYAFKRSILPNYATTEADYSALSFIIGYKIF